MLILQETKIQSKMKPTRYLTTFNLIEIEGEIDCNVNILIPGENMIILEAGEINYSKRHEWFDSGKTIQILHNGCSIQIPLKNLLQLYRFLLVTINLV